jgi:hypothetical protein
MPAVIQRETSIAANTTNDNVISGSAFEYARVPSVASIACVGAATGLFATIQAGPTIVLEESPVLIRTTMPVIPDDFYYTAALAPGDRIVVRVRNSTGAAVVARTVVQLAEV